MRVTVPAPAFAAGRTRCRPGVLVVVLAVLLALLPAAFTSGVSAGTVAAPVVHGTVESSASAPESVSVSASAPLSVLVSASDGWVEFAGCAGECCTAGSVHVRVRCDYLTERPAVWTWHASAVTSPGPAPPAAGRIPLFSHPDPASSGRVCHGGNRAPPVSCGIRV